jgi:hypothetical protein
MLAAGSGCSLLRFGRTAPAAGRLRKTLKGGYGSV